MKNIWNPTEEHVYDHQAVSFHRCDVSVREVCDVQLIWVVGYVPPRTHIQISGDCKFAKMWECPDHGNSGKDLLR